MPGTGPTRRVRGRSAAPGESGKRKDHCCVGAVAGGPLPMHLDVRGRSRGHVLSRADVRDPSGSLWTNGERPGLADGSAARVVTGAGQADLMVDQGENVLRI